MRKVSTVLLLAAVFAVAQGCADRQFNQAVETADSFVKAYFAAEYDQAAALCGEELKEKVMESASQISSLPDTLKSAFMELASEMETYPGDVYDLGGDSVIVDFDILVPGEMEPMRNSVVLVRNRENKSWTVVEFR